MRIRAALLVLLAAPLADAGGTDSTISNSCAPWDGPALSLTIGTGFPKLYVHIYRNLPAVAPASVILKGDDLTDNGSVSYCIAEGRCERPSEAKIDFNSFMSGQSASGRYELRLKSGKKLRGKFDAAWQSRRELCG